MIVLDTNVFSELMRPEPSAEVLAWMRAQVPRELRITAITVAEVRTGIAKLPDGRRRSILHLAAEEVFASFAEQVLAFDAMAADAYAELVSGRVRLGQPIGGFDAQIAAICSVNQAGLATRDQGFASLGLDLVNPWAHAR